MESSKQAVMTKVRALRHHRPSSRLGGTVGGDREAVTIGNEAGGKDSIEITKRVICGCSTITRVPSIDALCLAVAVGGWRATDRTMKIKRNQNDRGLERI